MPPFPESVRNAPISFASFKKNGYLIRQISKADKCLFFSPNLYQFALPWRQAIGIADFCKPVISDLHCGSPLTVWKPLRLVEQLLGGPRDTETSNTDSNRRFLRMSQSEQSAYRECRVYLLDRF